MSRNLPHYMRHYKTEFGISGLDAPMDRPFFDRRMFHPSLAINGLHGGYGGPKSKTVLPHEAIAKCDVRLVEAQTPDDVFAKIAAHVRRHAPDVEFVPLNGRLPSKTPMDSVFGETIRKAIVAAHGVPGGLMSYAPNYGERRDVCGQDPQRCEACRFADRAADQVRTGDQYP